MLKGKNTLEVNQASMCAIVQFFLEHQFSIGKSPTVTSVTALNPHEPNDGFRITLIAPPQLPTEVSE